MGSPGPGLQPRQGLHPLSISLRHGAPCKAQLSPLLGDPPSSRVAVLPSPDGHTRHLGATHSGRGSSGQACNLTFLRISLSASRQL